MKHGRIDPGADPERLQEFFKAVNEEHAEAADSWKRQYKEILLRILKERGYDPDTGEWNYNNQRKEKEK